MQLLEGINPCCVPPPASCSGKEELREVKDRYERLHASTQEGCRALWGNGGTRTGVEPYSLLETSVFPLDRRRISNPAVLAT